MDKFNIDIFTSKLAIGSLWIVSIFLFTCGFYNIYPFVENLSNTKTWTAIVTIPVLIFSYVIGSIVIHLSKTYIFPISKTSSDEIFNFIKISQENNQYLIKRYEETQYQYDFFSATIPTCIFLGVSVVWGAIRVLSSNIVLEYTLVILGLLTVSSSFILKFVIRDLKNSLNILVKSIDTTV
ncbi:hypothetical protein VB776_21505 [Arcicella sp. DC2W]|uniref:Uncharacterized protein n=1 Tax=Arcicella gelida TaxID=2984195 RepID=A0ABU5SAL6_9BACT|nr:hypothetical protein [Arcicella sp. DC2W]MEA5405531.1 hypothetical protein [Arcicella sp. DC2W]